MSYLITNEWVTLDEPLTFWGFRFWTMISSVSFRIENVLMPGTPS